MAPATPWLLRAIVGRVCPFSVIGHCHLDRHRRGGNPPFGPARWNRRGGESSSTEQPADNDHYRQQAEVGELGVPDPIEDDGRDVTRTVPLEHDGVELADSSPEPDESEVAPAGDLDGRRIGTRTTTTTTSKRYATCSSRTTTS